MGKQDSELDAQKIEEVIQWYEEECGTSDLPTITDGRASWSVNDIVKEIRSGTEEGRGFLRDLLRMRDPDRPVK